MTKVWPKLGKNGRWFATSPTFVQGRITIFGYRVCNNVLPVPTKLDKSHVLWVDAMVLNNGTRMVRHIKFEGFIERQFLVVARRIELLNFDVLKIRTTVVVRRLYSIIRSLLIMLNIIINWHLRCWPHSDSKRTLFARRSVNGFVNDQKLRHIINSLRL